MHRITLLFLSFAMLTPAGYSQTDTIPFKDANTIIIKTGLSNADALYKFGKHLTQSGFNLERYDDLFFTLATEPKNTSKFNWDFIINTNIADTGIIIIRVKWQVKSSIMAGTDATGYFDWEYMRGKNNAGGRVYMDFSPMLYSFGDYEILYERLE